MSLSDLISLNINVDPFEPAMNWETEESILLDDGPSAVELDAELNPKEASRLCYAYDPIMEHGTTNFSPLSNLIARIIWFVEDLFDTLEHFVARQTNFSIPTTTQPQNQSPAPEQFINIKGDRITL